MQLQAQLVGWAMFGTIFGETIHHSVYLLPIVFLLFPNPWSKNFFYKIFLTFTKESKTGKQEMELSKQEVELFLLLTELHPKIFFNPIIIGVSESQQICFNISYNIYKTRLSCFNVKTNCFI